MKGLNWLSSKKSQSGENVVTRLYCLGSGEGVNQTNIRDVNGGLPYLLAEHPDWTAKEALEESKRIMKNRKGQYFLLLLSFIGWSLASNLLQLSLMSISGIAAIVAGLFVNCWVSAYVNASVAVFYKTVSEDGGEEKARQDWERIMQNMQNGVNFPGNPWNGPDDDDSGDDQDDDDSLN